MNIDYTSQATKIDSSFVGQKFKLWTMTNDMFITDILMFVGGTNDNKPKNSIRLSIGNGPNLDEWTPEIQVPVSPSRYVSLASLIAGIDRNYFAGGDDVYVKIISSVADGWAQVSFFGIGIPY